MYTYTQTAKSFGSSFLVLFDNLCHKIRRSHTLKTSKWVTPTLKMWNRKLINTHKQVKVGGATFTSHLLPLIT
jgi:hypothetical protein